LFPIDLGSLRKGGGGEQDDDHDQSTHGARGYQKPF
jgi:hypothetical protein